MQDYDGIVGIYSKVNILSDKLKEKFEQKYLDVKIFDDFSNIELNHLSYLILNLIDFKESLLEIQNHIRGVECKILIVHPLTVKNGEKFVTDSELSNLISLNNNIGILLVPEILGKGVSFNPLYVSHDLIMQSILSERVKIYSDSRLINTISISKLAERIVKDTFSFGISSQIIALIGPRKSKKVFTTKYLSVKEENIVYIKGDQGITDLFSNASVKLDFSLHLAVKNTRELFFATTDKKVEESLIPEEIKIVRNSKKTVIKDKLGKFGKLFLFTISLSLIPILLIIMSFTLLYVSSKYIFTKNSLSNFLLSKSQITSNMARNLSFGNNFIYDSSNIINEVSSLGIEGASLVNSSRKFADKIMSDEPYDLSIYSDEISASLDKIHTDISFLQSDINDLNGFVGNVVKNKLYEKKIDIGEYKNKIYNIKNLFSRIAVILGADSPKKYLILFQNNMELRPTGGFIGSFGLLTFDKGRMSEIVINDVYMADGQLKGHVDPPEPIRKYLGEGGWYLRDSNWDPNFPVSAAKAEWFLEKEIGDKVDGVISIDLNFVKRLLLITGPISLPEFNITINSDNLYQVIQSEVESEFFPGSIKKATILTSLSKTLILELQNLKEEKYLSFFKELYESLERRHIQIYMHDNNANESISNLNYAGEIDLSSDCGPRCVKDSYQLVDANLGVNKSNYYIKRSHELNLSVSRELIGHELLVTYDNSANPAVGNSGVYKNYARILLPTNAKIGGIRIYDQSGGHDEIQYDLIDTDGRKEAGFYFEVLPSTKRRIQIVWNITTDSLKEGGQYQIKIIKQAGTDEDKLDVNIRSSDLSLTGKSSSSYNTNLARDFKVKMFFKI